MNSGTTFALPGPPSDRGWARQPLGGEEREGGNDDSLGRGEGWWQDRFLAWLSTGLVYLSRGESRKKRAPCPAVFHGLDH